MPTTVTKTIKRDGSGDYTTIALWAASFAARDLVANDEVQRGELFSDGTAHSTVGVTIDTGVTADSTRYVLLTTGTGQSFMDNANKLTDPLKYDASKGAAVTSMTYYVSTLTAANANTIVEKAQIFHNVITVSTGGIRSAATGSTWRNLLVDSIGTYGGAFFDSVGVKIYNSFFSSRKSGGGGRGVQIYSGGEFYGVTCAASTAQAQTTGFDALASTNSIAIQCASFGFTVTASFSTSHWDTGTSDRNAADDTNTPGGNSQDSLTYANQYVSTTADWHVKTGSGLISNGGVPYGVTFVDIFGSIRDSSACTIGCEEFIAAAAAGAIARFAPNLRGNIGVGLRGNFQ